MSTIAKGGKALYGAPLGILMLEARFPRIPGDMGNATTWPFPVLYKVVADHLETFLAALDADPDAKGLPAYVQREFYNYLQCAS